MHIALIPMSAKPLHKGHYNLIKTASEECDRVWIFASLADRKKKGEFPILGSQMKKVWYMMLPHLPKNASLQIAKSPITAVWETLGEANEKRSEDVFIIYSDPVDLKKNFSDASLDKYAGFLNSNDQVILRAVSRDETGDISGTMMRKWLQEKDHLSFINNLPEPLKERGLEIINLFNDQTTS